MSNNISKVEDSLLAWNFFTRYNRNSYPNTELTDEFYIDRLLVLGIFFFDAMEYSFNNYELRNSRDCKFHLGDNYYTLSAGNITKEMLVRRQKMKLCCTCTLFPSLLRKL
jgi:hypothetical protein